MNLQCFPAPRTLFCLYIKTKFRHFPSFPHFISVSTLRAHCKWMVWPLKESLSKVLTKPSFNINFWKQDLTEFGKGHSVSIQKKYTEEKLIRTNLEWFAWRPEGMRDPSIESQVYERTPWLSKLLMKDCCLCTGQSALLMYGPNISQQLKMERFSTAYKGMDSGAKGWCQILSCTWCISRDLAGSLAKTEHVFVHIQHPLRDSLLKLLLRLCLAPEVLHRKIQHILGDVLGRDSGGFDPRKCSR